MSIENSYNTWASQYDTNKNETRDLDRQVTIDTLSSYAFESVLELGCGTGKNTAFLLSKAKKIISLDFSQEMLNRAKAKIKNTKVTFRKTDLNLDWSVENEFADLITCSLTLEHIENLNHIFAQANQKLKADGLFFICEYHPFKHYAGRVARFDVGNDTIELEVFTHHLSEYVNEAQKNDFTLLEMKEWFDDEAKESMPRLVSFVFKK